jgi:hypothetical protein
LTSGIGGLPIPTTKGLNIVIDPAPLRTFTFGLSGQNVAPDRGWKADTDPLARASTPASPNRAGKVGVQTPARAATIGSNPIILELSGGVGVLLR